MSRALPGGEGLLSTGVPSSWSNSSRLKWRRWGEEEGRRWGEEEGRREEGWRRVGEVADWTVRSGGRRGWEEQGEEEEEEGWRGEEEEGGDLTEGEDNVVISMVIEEE